MSTRADRVRGGRCDTLTAITLIACLRTTACAPEDAASRAIPSAAAVGRVSGATSAPERRRIARVVRGPAMLVVIDSESVSTCEDLGRQLRELQRTTLARRQPTVVATPRRDAAIVAAWLTRERITRAAQLAIADSLYAGGARVRAPAVLLLDSSLVVRVGVIHRTRVNNTRARSFVQELGLQ